VQDVYAAKGSKTFWHYKIGCYKNGETQIKYFLVKLQGRKKSLYNKDFLRP